MKTEAIPFNLASVEGRELEFVADAVANGHIAGNGPYTARCERLLESLTGARRALLTTSCTHALEMAALLLELKPGDEVIVPSFTFVSTINAFVVHGAQPVFADIRPDTLNLDERQLPRLITRRARAIVPVHYAGVGCELEAILALAADAGIPVVEDNAHGLFGRYKGRPLGAYGELATLSFHETKNITCGEGGALLINDPRFCDRAEIIRDKGTNRARFFRGQVDRYTWVDLGSSYVLSDVLAGFLHGQLLQHEQIQLKRRQIWTYYYEHLQDWAAEHQVGLPVVPAGCEQPWHLFYLLMPSQGSRQALIAYLKARGIAALFHYQPLHLSTMGRRFGGRKGMCPVTEQVSDRLVRLPFYRDMAVSDLAEVVSAIKDFSLDAGPATRPLTEDQPVLSRP